MSLGSTTPDLSGNIAAFDVRETLQLLAGAGKSGELRVNSDAWSGRILLHSGQIAYATTATGSDTVDELDRLLERYQSDDRLLDGRPGTLEEALEEKVTEVLYEATGRTSGSFEFYENGASDGAAAVHLSTVDAALHRVDDRIAEWGRLRRVIPANDSVFTLAPRLPHGTNEATFDGLTWRLVALIGDGGSVDFIAGELEISHYRAARLLAALVEAGYVEPDGARTDRPEAAGFTFRPADGDPPAARQMQPEDAPVEDAPADEAAVPSVPPPAGPVTFSAGDLSEEEKNALIRNIGNGIFPS